METAGKKVDLLGLFPGSVRGFKRREGAECWTLNNFWDYMDGLPTRVFELHRWCPPVIAKEHHWNQDLIYTVYAKKYGLKTVFTSNMVKHPLLENAGVEEKLDLDELVDVRWGGPKLFHSSISYMLAVAVEKGFTDIRLHSIWMISTCEYHKQVPSLLYMLKYIEENHKAVKITIEPPVLKTLWIDFCDGFITPVKTKTHDPHAAQYIVADCPRTKMSQMLLKQLGMPFVPIDSEKAVGPEQTLDSEAPPYHISGIADTVDGFEKWMLDV